MANNRRKSVADEALMTQNYIQNNIEILTKLWDEVYMSEENRVARLSTAYDHIRTLVDDMVHSEQAMVDAVKSDIHSGMDQIAHMREQLSMDPWTGRHPHPSIALLRSIEKEEKQLKEIYEARKQEQEEIFERIQVLCFRLGKFAVDLLPETKKMLSAEELEECKGKMREMEMDLAERLEKAKSRQADIQQWYKNLGSAFGPGDDVTLHVIIDTDIEDDGFALSDSVLEKIEQFWTELSAMHKSWVDNVDLEWVTRYSQLEELWEKCHVGEAFRLFAPRFDPSRHGESDVEEMSAEITRLQSQYKDREPVYNLIAEWKTAWKEKLDIEEMKKDPSYYQSRERGHSLMKDAQHERHVNEVKLPKLKRGIIAAYVTFKTQHVDECITIDGHEPLGYIEWTENEYKLKKEMERTAKKNMKDTPRSPAKATKSAPRTPLSTKIPTKQMRMAMDPQVSIITPIRTTDGGPKTSSPKESPMVTPRHLQSPMRRRNF